MEQSPSWEAYRFSASQEIPRILWNGVVLYLIHKSSPPGTVLSQFNPAILPSHFFDVHCYLVLPSTPRSSNWSLSLGFPHQNPICTSPLPHTCYSPVHLMFLQFIIRMIFGEERSSQSTSLCSHLHSPAATYKSRYFGKICNRHICSCQLRYCFLFWKRAQEQRASKVRKAFLRWNKVKYIRKCRCKNIRTTLRNDARNTPNSNRFLRC